MQSCADVCEFGLFGGGNMPLPMAIGYYLRVIFIAKETRVKLTDEQQNIVRHHQGAAIVYAVAGAGKSTTMAYRVKHLVQHHHISPKRILVCSFSRETVNDMRQKMEDLGVTGVQCQTFNALGRKIVQQAINYGHWQAFDESQIEHRGSMLAMRALVEMSRRNGKNFAALDVNQDDLQTFISICKGNLRYADLAQAQLPTAAMRDATQADHLNKNYVQAYQIYEQLRQQHNWLTFDDQLLLAWEALERFSTVREWAKNNYDYVLIDEFQDVNKVQVQIADILTESHRNYMAIGDDDQCIYEWRGADVRFILDFKQRYHATEYVISDNFRCPAEATLLAGQVIAQNQQRHRKDLVSQKGFGGNVVLQGFDGDNSMADYVVQHYQELLAQGTSPKEVVVLVRSYSQTPAIEAKLIQQGLAYHVVGSQRFYERPEVKVLFTYLSFARQERDYMAQGGTGELSEQYLRRFADILRHPNRYLSAEWINQAVKRGQYQQCSLVSLLETQQLSAANETSQKRLQKLAIILRQLQQRLEQPISDTLSWLISELAYLEALKNEAGIPELGEERCNNVRALVNYALKKGSGLAFLDHLRKLHLDEAEADHHAPRLQLMSIHRSKGLEWQTVFVPCCADEQLPSANNNNIEEERRLLYVAITRTKHNLHLLYAPQNKASIFLREVLAQTVLDDARQLKQSLQASETTLQTEDVIGLALGLKKYPLARYLQHWWQPAQGLKQAIKRHTQLALAKQIEAKQQIDDFKAQLVDQHTQAQQQQSQIDALKSLQRRLKLFKIRPVTVILDHTAPEQGFAHTRFKFELVSGDRIAVLTVAGKKVGYIDPQASKFPLGQIQNWSWVEAVVSVGFRFSYLRRTMNVTVELAKNATELAMNKVTEPPRGHEQVMYLASDEFKRDIQNLLSFL